MKWLMRSCPLSDSVSKPCAQTLGWPLNPMSYTTAGRNMIAACEVFENITRRYGKPEFGIKNVSIAGVNVAGARGDRRSRGLSVISSISIATNWKPAKRDDPKVLIIAPMSGHYATLLRGTVETMLPEHDVFITDWADARNVPIAAGRFDFDDFVDYVVDFIRFIGPNTHVMAVCQPAVPALVAAALMAARNDDRPNPPRLY